MKNFDDTGYFKDENLINEIKVNNIINILTHKETSEKLTRNDLEEAKIFLKNYVSKSINVLNEEQKFKTR